MFMFNLFDPFWDVTPIWGPVYIKVYTNSTGGSDKDCDKCVCNKEVDTKEAEKASENHKECEALRKEFSTFINSLDDRMFKQICRSFTNEELDKMNNLIFGYRDDKEALEESIAAIKAKNNEIITEKIMSLKSQMV